jgi:hypothetical protein
MKHYWTGFAVAMTVMVLLNLVPYVLSRGSYATDGLEVAGFPFRFWRMGGFSFVREFEVQSLIADIAIALAMSTVAGGLWMEHTRHCPRLAISLRFTIRDLLWLTAFSAIAIASWMVVFKTRFEFDLGLFLLTLIAAGTTGAAIGALFREQAVCGGIALVISVFVYLIRLLI